MEKKNFKINAHVVLLIAIVLIFFIALIRLLIWNKGQDSEYDPNEDTSQFDVETEDYIVYVDPAALENREDDGVTTILCLGNEPFASERGENGIAAQLEQALDATVYNCAFNNTTLSAKNTAYDANYVQDAFSLYWLTRTLVLQDFTLLDNSIDDFSKEDSHAAKTLALLKEVDLEKVDILTIMYDGTDYLEDRIITSPYDLSDIGTCTGSLGQALDLLTEAYPHIRIVVLSPTFACMPDENGDYQLGSTTRTKQNEYVLSDYMIAYKNVAAERGVTFIDHYNGTVTEGNYKEYLTDHILLNDKGRKAVADRIISLLKQS